MEAQVIFSEAALARFESQNLKLDHLSEKFNCQLYPP